MLFRDAIKLIMFITILTAMSGANAAKPEACDGDSKSSNTFKTQQGVFKSSLEILGPLYLGSKQSLRVCSSDLSQQLPNPGSARRSQSHWVSIGVEVYRSTNMLEPLEVKSPDIVFSGGKGGCVELTAADFPGIDEKDSLVVVLTSISEARSGISPVANGQFFNGVDEPAGLLLPAVIAAREAGSDGGLGGNSQPKHCCPGWPACAFGVCP